MKTKYYFLLLVIALISPAYSQSSEIYFTGRLYADSKMLMEKDNIESPPQLTFQKEDKKSPLLAAALSLVLPGAGEFYNGDYIRSAIFLAVEAAVVTTAVIYNNKAIKQTESFQNFADQNWDVTVYAKWLNSVQSEVNIKISDNKSLPPWDRISWSELNKAEDAAAAQIGSGFTHRLPQHGTQQYYELIGKYSVQYSIGWAEQEPTIFDQGFVVPLQMHQYSLMRGKANDYYNVASKAVIGIYINHFLSLLDAIWVTVDHNKSLAVKMRMEENYYVTKTELVPTLKLSFRF